MSVLSIYLYDIVTGPHRVFEKKIQVRCSFSKLATRYTFFEYPGAFQPLPLCFIPRYEENASCGPAVSCSGSFYAINPLSPNVADLQHFDIVLFCGFSLCNAFRPSTELFTGSLLEVTLSEGLVKKAG